MRKTSQCKIEGCFNPREEGAFLCAFHLTDKRRCEGLVKTYDDQGVILSSRQCKKAARPGNTTCAHHGASSPAARASEQKALALTAMQKFVKPYDGPLNPISAFEAEYRRTYGRIIWLEDQIADLEDESALTFGLVKEEEIGAGEFTGTNRTYETRIHIFEEMLRWERKHLLELTKVYIRANLDERKLGMMREYLEGTYRATLNLVAALGHDPQSPEVKDKIRRMFEDADAIEA